MGDQGYASGSHHGRTTAATSHTLVLRDQRTVGGCCGRRRGGGVCCRGCISAHQFTHSKVSLMQAHVTRDTNHVVKSCCPCAPRRSGYAGCGVYDFIATPSHTQCVRDILFGLLNVAFFLVMRMAIKKVRGNEFFSQNVNTQTDMKDVLQYPMLRPPTFLLLLPSTLHWY